MNISSLSTVNHWAQDSTSGQPQKSPDQLSQAALAETSTGQQPDEITQENLRKLFQDNLNKSIVKDEMDENEKHMEKIKEWQTF
jgi:hypothetical protein